MVWPSLSLSLETRGKKTVEMDPGNGQWRLEGAGKERGSSGTAGDAVLGVRLPNGRQRQTFCENYK